MGYDVHITRAACWLDGEETPITLDEWRSYVASDPELMASDPELMIGQSDDCISAGWYGEGGHPNNSKCVGGFWWDSGCIVEKNPSKAEIGKMTRIALALNARVVGDEDEEYRPNGEVYEEQFIDRPPGIFRQLWSWMTGKPLPERKSAWVCIYRWDEKDE